MIVCHCNTVIHTIYIASAGGATPPGVTSYCHGQACKTSADCNTQYCDCTAGYTGVLGCYYKTPP